MTVYAIQHERSKLWITVPPSSGRHRVSSDAHQAETWEFMSIAELERLAIGPFADAYVVVPIRGGDLT